MPGRTVIFELESQAGRPPPSGGRDLTLHEELGRAGIVGPDADIARAFLGDHPDGTILAEADDISHPWSYKGVKTGQQSR